MDTKQLALQKHEEWKGKIEVVSRAPLQTREDLSLAYTPGVAQPCLAIEKDPSLSYTLTRRANLVAVITDGTAVLGLGDIGPLAAMPVMEGKCALFKAFADVDAFPLCVASKDVDEIVRTVALIGGSFGGINLEDIAAPRCFEIEKKLKEQLDIPVFHDDQHGTAIVAGAALLNAVQVTGRTLSETTVVVNGAGAAGIAVSKLLLALGVKDLILCDIDGAIYPGAPNLNDAQSEMSLVTNRGGKKGTLGQVLQGADVFFGVSKPNLVTAQMVRSMAPNPIVFAMANPIPEILPEDAKKGGAAVVGTGRSDYPNQINNVLAFPGVFKGALAVRAKDITDSMKVAAAHAIAGVLQPDELSETRILPDPFDKRVAAAVAASVAETARREGLAQID